MTKITIRILLPDKDESEEKIVTRHIIKLDSLEMASKEGKLMKYSRDKFPTSWEEHQVLVKKRKVKWFTED